MERAAQEKAAAKAPAGPPEPIPEIVVTGQRRTVPAPTPRRRGILTPRMARDILLGVATAGSIFAATRSRRAAATSVAAAVAPQAQPLSQPTRVLTGSSSNVCEVQQQEKKKRKTRRRKCRQSAPITWAGGRKKGQSAGRKCFAFSKL